MKQGNLFERIRNICERPRMFAPHFSLEHLLLFIHGYEASLSDMKQPSQHERFEAWLNAQHPEWRASSMWWGKHVLETCGGDLEHTLTEIIKLVDQFMARESVETP